VRTKTIAENAKSAFAAAPINSEEQCQHLRNCEPVDTSGCYQAPSIQFKRPAFSDTW
jgi:hypothetical protein